jgi:hypothetical protein
MASMKIPSSMHVSIGVATNSTVNIPGTARVAVMLALAHSIDAAIGDDQRASSPVLLR